MKKKICLLLSFIMAVTLMFGMSVTAFADESPNRWNEVSYDTGIVALVDDDVSEEIFYISYGYGTPVDVTTRYYFGDTLVFEYSESFGNLTGSDGVGINNTIASAIDTFYYDESLFPGKTVDDIDRKIRVTWDGTNKILSSYFYFKNTNPDPNPAPTPGHTHNFEWQIISEPSLGADGLEAEVCTICGARRNEQTVSAYGYALYSYGLHKLNGAQKGQTVVLDFGEWNSFPKKFMEKVKEKVDAGVTVTFKYKYQHVPYEITIPAYSKVYTNLEWCGPACMYQLYVLGIPVENQ